MTASTELPQPAGEMTMPIRRAIERHVAAIYEAGDPTLSPWPEDPDGSTLRFVAVIHGVLDLCDAWNRTNGSSGDPKSRLICSRIASALEM